MVVAQRRFLNNEIFMPEKDKEGDSQLFTHSTFMNSVKSWEGLKAAKNAKALELNTEGKTGNRQVERDQHAGMFVTCSETAE